MGILVVLKKKKKKDKNAFLKKWTKQKYRSLCRLRYGLHKKYQDKEWT